MNSENLKKILDNFSEMFENICLEKNCVIGGSMALQMHGLNFRDSNDLDIIIYSPSERQLLIFNHLKPFEIKTKTTSYFQRSFKYKKNGYYINFVLEEDLKLPENLLIHQSGWMVNSIKNIVKAKYEYSRTKDLFDLINLKNKNF